MNRFEDTKKKKPFGKALWSVIVFAAIVAFFCYALTGFSKDSSDRMISNLETAINRDITHYYASEGRYPETLDELSETYGLSWNEDEIFVGYRSMGANIFPDVTVIPLEN